MAITTIKIGDRDVNVDTSIADRLLAANEAKVKATGTPIKINEGHRTTERQRELYEKSQRGEIGRAAPPGKSFHETGKAIDVGDYKESEKYLKTYGLVNDLSGDKGHFSIGETRKEKFKNFADNVETLRQKGATDTQILNIFVKQNPNSDIAKKIKQTRDNYSTNKKLTNDRDLTNFLALRLSGVGTLKTPSVPTREQQIGEEATDVQIVDIDGQPAEKPKGFLQKVGDFGKEVVKGIAKPVVKSFLAPGQAIVSAATGETPTDLQLPFLGDVTPPKTVREGVGTALQTGLLGLGGGVAAGGKGLAKTIAKEAAIGAGFGLGTGLEEEKKGKELIAPTAVGGVLGAASPVAIKGAGKVAGKFLEKIKPKEKVSKEFLKKSEESLKGLGLKSGEIGSKAVEKGKEVAKFGAGQLTGLKQETIKSIVKNPEKFTKEVLESVDRESVAKGVVGKINERLSALKDTGKGYNKIRQSDELVNIPEDGIRPVLNKYNISLDVDGKIVTSPESIPLSPTDKKALQDFIDVFGKETELSANSFLNARQALSNLSAFETGKTNAATTMSKELRKFYDDLGKKQLTGLKELDSSYSKEVGILKQIKKDYFDKQGNLKDGAVNKIANLKGTGKQQVLDRLKNIVPDIEDQLSVLKAIEDIEYASGRAIGTYARSAIGAGGIVTGNVPAIIASIISTPKLAVPLLRKFGEKLKTKQSVIDDAIESLKTGKKPTGESSNFIKKFLTMSDEQAKKLIKQIPKPTGAIVIKGIDEETE